MAVIINDFEILVDPPAQAGGPASGASAERPQAAAPALRPEDIERIIRHFEARRERVAAD